MTPEQFAQAQDVTNKLAPKYALRKELERIGNRDRTAFDLRIIKHNDNSRSKDSVEEILGKDQLKECLEVMRLKMLTEISNQITTLENEFHSI